MEASPQAVATLLRNVFVVRFRYQVGFRWSENYAEVVSGRLYILSRARVRRESTVNHSATTLRFQIRKVCKCLTLVSFHLSWRMVSPRTPVAEKSCQESIVSKKAGCEGWSPQARETPLKMALQRETDNRMPSGMRRAPAANCGCNTSKMTSKN